MSLDTWKRKFYPKAASETTPEEAVAHSLKKWEGLLPENLVRHNVRLTDTRNVTGASSDLRNDVFRIDYSTCSLCFHFEHTRDEGEDACRQCPLSIERDNLSCDVESDDEFMDGAQGSPWDSFTDADEPDPRPMILWLKRTLNSQQNAK